MPSRRNCTPETPVLSEAVAETVTAAPETVVRAAGVVRETEGAVVSGVGVAAGTWLMNRCAIVV